VYSVPAAGRLSPQLACRQPPINYSELKECWCVWCVYIRCVWAHG